MKAYRTKKNVIGEPLKKALTENDITVTQFANDIGVSRITAQYYLSNRQFPSDETLEKIADYFQLPAEYFTGESFDAEGNETDNYPKGDLREFFSQKFEAHQIRGYGKSAIKALNLLLVNSSVEEQTTIVRELYDLIYDHQHGVEIINLRDSSSFATEFLALNSVLESIRQELGEQSYKEKEIKLTEIKKRIELSKNTTTVERKNFAIYRNGFEAGVLTSLSNERFNKLDILRTLSFYRSTTIDQFNRFVLCDIDDLFGELRNPRSFKTAIKTIDVALRELDSKESRIESWEANEFITKLQSVDDSVFEMASALLFDLINSDKEKLKNDLESLKTAIQTKMDETIKLADHYK